jgi:hypothetical protein
VPARTDVPVMGLMSDKNWVVANAVEAIAGHPPQRSPARCSGQLGANYTQRPGFGKVRPAGCSHSAATGLPTGERR